MSRDATPLMQQYHEIKAQHANAILLFRMGDFYEMFYDDAETAARVLGLTLTSRNNGGAAEVPLAGSVCLADGLDWEGLGDGDEADGVCGPVGATCGVRDALADALEPLLDVGRDHASSAT